MIARLCYTEATSALSGVTSSNRLSRLSQIGLHLGRRGLLVGLDRELHP